MVEEGGTDEVLRSPREAYTQALLAAVPDPDPHRSRRRRVA
ncbi:hypothetical protein [Pseudonocardia zijingensis]|uniref:Oligopeptide/dipeptide ABC transporter C-terminal domain-containing protein n=1 Tax=Pseudonocardia zijingensis TaxID=153376 RepID=A0ABP4A5G4_9PSEU